MTWDPVAVWRAIDDATMTSIKAAVAFGGMCWLAWDLFLERRGEGEKHRGLRDRGLAILGALAFACWWNLGHFHHRYRDFVHIYDQYHYFVGAKYFEELGYDRLYLCTAAAEVELGRSVEVSRSRLRDLTTNEFESPESIVRDPTICSRHFTPARWSDFKRDIEFFRESVTRERWLRMQADHGFNATPVWLIAGGWLANSGPASWDRLFVFGLIDSLLLCIMWGAIAYAFGWRAMCVALIFWGTNYPARFFWNGGSLLRMDWLVATVAGVCLVKQRKMAAGGFALTVAALLRIFPGFVVVGLLMKALAQIIRERRLVLDPAYARFAAGCLAALITLLPISAVVAGRAAWLGDGERPGFVQNAQKHLALPLENSMGLKTLLAYDRSRTDAPMTVTELAMARRATFENRRPIFIVAVIAFLGLLAWVAAKREDWIALVLGAGLIPIAAELTCYYYSFVLLFGFLWIEQKKIGVGLCFSAFVSCILASVFERDVARYTWTSLVMVAFAVAATIHVRAVSREG